MFRQRGVKRKEVDVFEYFFPLESSAAPVPKERVSEYGKRSRDKRIRKGEGSSMCVVSVQCMRLQFPKHSRP